jgi:putative endonuclease
MANYELCRVSSPQAAGVCTPRNESSHIRGREGENTAARALERTGMRIVDRNVRSKVGEIDLVALDGESLVFTEVKNWPAYGIENLAYGINEKKKRRIIETAKYFLSVHREYNDRPIRFDVVFLNRGKGISRFKSAFMENV